MSLTNPHSVVLKYRLVAQWSFYSRIMYIQFSSIRPNDQKCTQSLITLHSLTYTNQIW